jgi:hypothetical protein
MTLEITQDPELIRVRLSGVFTPEDLTEIGNAADEIERGRDPVPSRITDMTAVTELKIGYPEVKALANRRRAIPFSNAFKSAIVVRTPAQKGMARMFQTLNDNPRITIEIFDDEPSALDWLRS